jgi:hypothetical protein
MLAALTVAIVALQVHLNGKTAEGWPIELRSAWSRFVVALHFRHPDAMPEFRAAAKSVWDGSGAKYQKDYEAIKKPEDPPTFDDYLATRDPLAGNKMHVNLIIKIFDNDILGEHLNNMHWSVLDVSGSNHRFLLSCRSDCSRVGYCRRSRGANRSPLFRVWENSRNRWRKIA